MDKRTETLNKARKVPGEHAGPKGSFPITDAQSVKSAWDLRGHAADPAQVGANIKREAAAKGLSGALPETAKKRGRWLG
jgi:hypothetical protein